MTILHALWFRFIRLRPRRTPMRKPFFCRDFCEEVRRNNIASNHATKTGSLLVAPLGRSSLPYAGFLFRSAAQALLGDGQDHFGTVQHTKPDSEATERFALPLGVPEQTFPAPVA